MRGQRADERTRAQWRKLIAAAVRSGRSIRAFCQERKITESQFYAWRRRLNGDRGSARPAGAMSGATFALVQEPGVTPEPAAGVELVWADGRRLRIGPGADAVTIRTVLAVLDPERC